MRSFHVCTSGGDDKRNRCYTLIEGKSWTQLFEEAWATGQRWYCKVCNARYRPGMGMLVELRASDGDIFWIPATYPREVKDCKWMRVEEDMGPVATPAELFARIQAIKPYLGDGMLRPATQSECWYGPCEGVYTFVDHNPFHA